MFKITTLLIGVVMLFSSANSFAKEVTAPKKATLTTKTTDTNTSKKTTKQTVAKIPELRDPTKPPSAATTSEATPEGIQVDAILYSKNRRIALIGGRELTVGDKIMGAEIVAIDAHSVRFRDASREFIVNISYPNVKVSAAENIGNSD